MQFACLGIKWFFWKYKHKLSAVSAEGLIAKINNWNCKKYMQHVNLTDTWSPHASLNYIVQIEAISYGALLGHQIIQNQLSCFIFGLVVVKWSEYK